MLTLLKNFFTVLILSSSINLWSDENPYNFIDSNAQKMVIVLKENKSLFLEDRKLYEQKIKEIFEPMIDFRRVAATVMGKKYYLASSKEQRAEFVVIFKDSLLDTYAETLAQWENQTITTIFPKNMEIQTNNLKNIEVQQTLNTGSSKYPISYKLRKNKDNSWSIVNIIVNGVNLGLTFRNQFQALAIKNNGNIESTLNGWVSDAGDAGISG
ncbi:MAG: ABC transporter substrate-binding protein [Proteobacteria bacterium]|jgi:phospholipid transport system substrate-binding protein|nr:ABC transporter substrate-binding protein [Pseudomonadota bacterium]NCV45503.1 ABC transporter substrate-binding protein [Pseudomonadota bacterium]NCW10423.1 ABC transporter substrate-binding protein [Pseudomonadota bacterium]NCW37561.1 ABC transporter substrate-binding protein [Pseudomonadota bacterium]